MAINSFCRPLHYLCVSAPWVLILCLTVPKAGILASRLDIFTSWWFVKKYYFTNLIKKTLYVFDKDDFFSARTFNCSGIWHVASCVNDGHGSGVIDETSDGVINTRSSHLCYTSYIMQIIYTTFEFDLINNLPTALYIIIIMGVFIKILM